MKLPDTATSERFGHKITRWLYTNKRRKTGPRYFAKCEGLNCSSEISITRKRREGNWLCRVCAGARGWVCGVRVRSAYVWAKRAEIVEMRKNPTGRGHTPFIRCTVSGCGRLVSLTNSRFRSGKNVGRCFPHSVEARRLRPFESAYNSFIKKTARRKHKVTLTYEQYAALCSEDLCHYCCSKLPRRPFADGGYAADSIDRKDPRVGYTKQNCVPCCALCNFTKGSMLSYSEMLIIGALRSNRARRAVTIARGYNAVSETNKISKFYHFVWKTDDSGRWALTRASKVGRKKMGDR